jgi:MoxR-like ATPase
MSKTKVVEEEKFYTKLGVSLASLKNARKAIEANRTSGNVICLVGAAGIGKTHLIRQVADDRVPFTPFEWHGQQWTKSVPVKALYLAHMQAEDMGVPYPSRAKRNELLKECDLFMRIAQMAQNGMGDRAKAHAMELAEHVLNSGSALEDGTFEFLVEKNLKDLPPEGILFLDEWNRADKSVIKAFFTLLEDREVHGHQLVPPGVQIVAAMNPSDGAYSVNEAEKDHAFRRRLSFIAVTANTGAWLEYADGRFHPHVVEFVKASPAMLYDTKLRDAGKAFPCPATWEKVSIILQDAEKTQRDLLDDGIALSISGHIGQAVGSQFMAYVKDNEVVINPEEVLSKYTDKSKVRRKVLRLVELARNDVLNEVCTSVAITLLKNRTEPTTIAPRLALFMGDLQPEMAIAMIVHKMGAAAEEIEDAESYLTSLSMAMRDQPAYNKLFKGIGEAMKKAREEVGETVESPLKP